MAVQAAQYRLLVVEDDLDCSDLVVRTAARSGYASLVASDPMSIAEALRNWRPHVITLDLCLPQIDGMEVIGLIRATGFEGDVIIVSGQAAWIRDLTATIARESGLSVPAHMPKPVDLNQLRELLAQTANTVGPNRRRSRRRSSPGIPATVHQPMCT
jgi:DNA-binding response OmpR family regulator